VVGAVRVLEHRDHSGSHMGDLLSYRQIVIDPYMGDAAVAHNGTHFHGVGRPALPDDPVILSFGLIFSLFVTRPWCRYLCPVPAFEDYLGFIRDQVKGRGRS